MGRVERGVYDALKGTLQEHPVVLVWLRLSRLRNHHGRLTGTAHHRFAPLYTGQAIDLHTQPAHQSLWTRAQTDAPCHAYVTGRKYAVLERSHQ
jgi:hypothetical protein